jgi:tetratricopeptide (TPR) repeat protein
MIRTMRPSAKDLAFVAALAASFAAVSLSPDAASAKDKDEKTDKKDDKKAKAGTISAYDQAIIDANKSFAAGLAGNVIDDAIAGYRKAIALDPNRPEGHLHLGAALFQKGDFPGAEEALVNAANRARADKAYANYLGKALFLTATLKEAQNKPDEAKTAWGAYADFCKSNPDQEYPKDSGPNPPMAVKTYPGSAVERETKIDNYAKMKVEYAKVKDLIEKRQKELGIGTPEKK